VKALIVSALALSLAGCATPVAGQAVAAPVAAPPAERVIVEENVGLYLDAVALLDAPSCCAGPLNNADIAKQRRDREAYGRQYCDALIAGVPVEDVVMDVFGSTTAQSKYAQDSAQLADQLLCPLP
jgi:hypothetical protein